MYVIRSFAAAAAQQNQENEENEKFCNLRFVLLFRPSLQVLALRNAWK